MTDQTPSVGRIVHYVSYGTPGGEYTKECVAAIVTKVEDSSTVDLCAFYPTGLNFRAAVMLDEGDEPAGGSWHWLERT